MNRRPIYDGHVVKLGLETAVLPDGTEVELEVIRHPGAAAVVPLHADGTITLVHQYRHAGGGMHLEVPAGKLDGGEAPESCAPRELAEETGLAATRWTSLGLIHTTPGFTDEVIHLYLAQDLSEVGQALEDDEYIELQRMPLADALELCASGGITDGKTICALFRAERHLRR